MTRVYPCLLLLASAIYQDSTAFLPPYTCLHTGCGVHGVCVDYGGAYRCSCAPGFEGTPTTCIPQGVGCKLNSCTNGVCIGQSHGSSVCRCKKGFVLSRGDNMICVPGAVNCPVRPCTRGRCVLDQTGARFCQCDSGYRRSPADPAVCEPDTSRNYYTRTVSVREDDCTRRPCQNAVCLNVRGVNTCVCVMGYKMSVNDKYVCEAQTQDRRARDCQSTGCTNGACVTSQTGAATCVCNRGYQLSIGTDNVCHRKYFPLPEPMGCDVYGCTNGYCSRRYGGTPYCHCHYGFQRHPFNRFQCIRRGDGWTGPGTHGETFMNPWTWLLLEEL